MQLNAVEFATLIRDLKCDVRPDERRANPRAPTRSRVEVVQVQPGADKPTPELIRVRDISRNGLGLMTSENLPPGRRMLVLLPKTATEMFVLLCEVARVTRLPGDQYAVGVRMVRRVTEEERSAFMRGSIDAMAALLSASSPSESAAPTPAAA